MTALTSATMMSLHGGAGPLAHVTYVVDQDKLAAVAGTDWRFLLSPLSDPWERSLLLAALGAVVGAFVIGELLSPIRFRCRALRDRLNGYRGYAPQILRMALGAALIAAGTQDALYLPNVAARGLGGLEVGVGFCLVVGFALRASGLAALALYLYGLFTSHYLLGAMECAAAALLIAAHGPQPPSVDDVAGLDVLRDRPRAWWAWLRDRTPLILRIALGGTLIWLAITEKAMNPRVSELMVIDYGLRSIVPVSAAMWVLAVGLTELLVGAALVAGLFTRTISGIALVILTLSLFYFRDEVSSHVTFFGCLLVLMTNGAGRWSVDAALGRWAWGASMRPSSGRDAPEARPVGCWRLLRDGMIRAAEATGVLGGGSRRPLLPRGGRGRSFSLPYYGHTCTYIVLSAQAWEPGGDPAADQQEDPRWPS